MKKALQVGKVTKLGYVKSIKGEIAVELQREHLIRYGVSKAHIYDGDGVQTIFDAIASLRGDNDQIVIYSGAIIGKYQFRKINEAMFPIPQSLYLCKSGTTIDFVEGEKFHTLFEDIKAIEKRDGAKGGKPSSISVKNHGRILAMRDDGLNAKEICAALGWPEERKTTVWRWMKKEQVK